MIVMGEEKGFALVLVLLVVALLVGMVTDFVYTVRHETTALYNWRDLQRLSIEAQTGIKVGEKFLTKAMQRYAFTYPERVDIPVPDVSGDGLDAMLVSVFDENARFNINRLINPNGTDNAQALAGFRRLLTALDIDETVAYLIMDWIDTDIEERVSGSEEGTKNGYFYSMDELKLVRGIDGEIFKKLSPHVTIFGDGLININSADKYVLMSLSDEITEELAKRVVAYRELRPFTKWQDLRLVAGFGTLYTSLAGRITVKGTAFTVIVTAYQDDLRKRIETVMVFSGTAPSYRYWKET